MTQRRECRQILEYFFFFFYDTTNSSSVIDRNNLLVIFSTTRTSKEKEISRFVFLFVSLKILNSNDNSRYSYKFPIYKNIEYSYNDIQLIYNTRIGYKTLTKNKKKFFVKI